MPLTKAEVWSKFMARYPHWQTEGADLTAAGLRNLFDAAFDAGVAHGKATAERRPEDVSRELYDRLFRRFS